MNEFVTRKEAILLMIEEPRLEYYVRMGLIKMENGLFCSQDCLTAYLRHKTNVDCGRAVEWFNRSITLDRWWEQFMAWRRNRPNKNWFILND